MTPSIKPQSPGESAVALGDLLGAGVSVFAPAHDAGREEAKRLASARQEGARDDQSWPVKKLRL
jgi:hypothetical protein